MAIIYTRTDTMPGWLTAPRLQVQIWNVLSDGPLNAWEIHRRLHGSDYTEIVGTLADMNRAGIVRAQYAH